MIFSTQRLVIQRFRNSDFDFFMELFSDPEIINPIPQKSSSLEEIKEKFELFTQYKDSSLLNKFNVYAVYEKGKEELIGLCGLINNGNEDKEIGYRFRVKYWGKGYGTEVTAGLIDYCFNQLQLDVITATANVENVGSIKILDKFFTPLNDFYNKEDACWDRNYSLKKEDFLMDN